MKIKKEYDIKFIEGNLDVYRLGNIKDLLHITDVQFKEQNKYVELGLKYPKNNISLLKSKSLNTNKFTMSSKGYTPKSQYYHMTLDQENGSVLLRKISTFYLFENKFEYLDTISDKQKEGLQFRKIESREEIEHRKRNINYKIKALERENFKSLKYVNKSQDLTEKIKSLNIENTHHKPKHMDRTGVSKRILSSIKKAVVVNVKDLEKLYKDKETIKTVLSKNTFYFLGRYILNNSFYSVDLIKIREKILEIVHKKGYILLCDIEKESFLIHELCHKKDNSHKYYLKGYHEEEDQNIIRNTVLADTIVCNIIQERYFCHLNDIIINCDLDLDTIKSVLFKDNVISVGKDIYTLAESDETCPELKQELIRLVQNKKSYRKGEMNTAITNISEALNIDESLIYSFIEKVFTNKRGIWTVKESFN